MKKILLLTLMCAHLTMACTSNNYSKEYEQTKASIDPNASCDRLWKELWPRAKKGDYVARDLLAELVAERGLKIPGQPSGCNWKRTYLTLALHEGMFGTSGDAIKKKFEIFLGSESTKNIKNISVADCFYTRHPGLCVDAASRWGIIESFEEFVKSVDSHLQVGEKAACAN